MHVWQVPVFCARVGVSEAGRANNLEAMLDVSGKRQRSTPWRPAVAVAVAGLMSVSIVSPAGAADRRETSSERQQSTLALVTTSGAEHDGLAAGRHQSPSRLSTGPTRHIADRFAGAGIGAAVASDPVGTVYNIQDNVLTRYPTVGMGAICRERWIYLSSGRYRLTTTIRALNRTLPVDLSAHYPISGGTYRWLTCITAGHPGNGDYSVGAALIDVSGRNVANLGHGYVPASGIMTRYEELVRWGSKLYREPLGSAH